MKMRTSIILCPQIQYRMPCNMKNFIQSFSELRMMKMISNTKSVLLSINVVKIIVNITINE